MRLGSPVPSSITFTSGTAVEKRLIEVPSLRVVDGFNVRNATVTFDHEVLDVTGGTSYLRQDSSSQAPPGPAAGSNEIDPALVDHLEFYLLDLLVSRTPLSRWRRENEVAGFLPSWKRQLLLVSSSRLRFHSKFGAIVVASRRPVCVHIVHTQEIDG